MKGYIATLTVWLLIATMGYAQSYQKTELGVRTQVNSMDIELSFWTINCTCRQKTRRYTC